MHITTQVWKMNFSSSGLYYLCELLKHEFVQLKKVKMLKISLLNLFLYMKRTERRLVGEIKWNNNFLPRKKI